jgi:hypothetical protein
VPKRILVVANRTAATPSLLDEVERRALAEPCEFALLVPDAPDRNTADWTLDLALPLLKRAAGKNVEGIVGTGGDPLDAIKSVLREREFDEVLMSTLSKRTSRWLRRDLPAQVEELGVKVTVMTPEPEQGGFVAAVLPPIPQE